MGGEGSASHPDFDILLYSKSLTT